MWVQGPRVCHHTLMKTTSLPSDAVELISYVTFVGRLGVRGEGDVVELAQAKPLAVHGHAKVAEINGLPRSLRDLVCGRSRGFALWRQIGHDDSADVRQSQHQGAGMKRVRELLFQGIAAKNHRVKEGAEEGVESSIQARGRRGQEDGGLRQRSAGVESRPLPPLFMHPPLSLGTTGERRCRLGKGFPLHLHPSSSSSSCYSFCADLEAVGGWCDLKCKRAGY